MIGSDLDGTLINFITERGAKPVVNERLIAQMKGPIWVITNQGGLPFGMRDQRAIDRNGIKIGVTKPRKFPIPEEFVENMVILYRVSARLGVEIHGLSVCTAHPSGELLLINRAASIIRQKIGKEIPELQLLIYTDNKHRKPSPDMLLDAPIERYFGDDDTDEQAAEAAGIEFTRVPKFEGVSL